MKRIILFIIGLLILYSCELTIKDDITSDYLIEGIANNNLDVYLQNNQIFRYKGKPGEVTIPIGNPDLSQYEPCFVLYVATGTTQETIVSSAIIKIDGIQVLNTSDFSKNGGQFTFEVCDITPTSEITVEVRGEPGSYIDIWIEGKLKTSSTYEAPNSQVVPTIDGQINTTEWSNGNTYDIVFIRPDGAETKPGRLLLQNDGTWLYIGVNTEVGSRWDVYLALKIDGNNDHILSGQSAEPHTDINVEYPAPGAWGGYIRYDYITSSNHIPVTPPPGTLRTSYGSTAVSYEFRIKLSDLNIGTDKTIGFYLFNFNYPMDGVGLVYEYVLINHAYEFPENLIMYDLSKWAHIVIK